MKPFIRTIMILVAVTLSLEGFAWAQNTPEEDIAVATEALAADAAREAQKQAQVALKRAENVQKEARELERFIAEKEAMKEALLLNTDRDKFILFSGKAAPASRYGSTSSTGQVLVVPTARTKPQDIAAITQDLKIMSRIFDKKLNKARGRMPRGGTIRLAGFSTSGRYSYKPFLEDDEHATRAIYIQDYGTLFLLKVDFPLSPPQEVKVKKTKKDTDPLWEQTKLEITAPETGTGTPRSSQAHYGYGGYEGEVRLSLSEDDMHIRVYDAETVEDLKRKLTTLIKHAANIQGLKPQDLVVLSVAGTSQPAVIKEILIENDKTIKITPKVYSTSPASSSTALLIRAKKSDIDAYSKGELNYDEFRQKVTIFAYPYLPGKVERLHSLSAASQPKL